MIPSTAPSVAPGKRAAVLRSPWPRRRPVIMGILNCTPDSFFDGGRHREFERAVEHGLRMVREGAEILDVGGESTRPGAEPVSAAVEIERVVGVIRELRQRRPETILSVDTSKAEVAAEALTAGADLVNDVTAGADPEMLSTVARFDAGIVLMHMRGRPRTMQVNPRYSDVVAEVHGFLWDRARAAERAGIQPDLVWLDPGIGFGKDDEANLRLLAALGDLEALGHPVVLGVSMKSMIGRLTGAEVDQRLPGSLAALTPAFGLDRAVVRVHDPGPTLQFLRMLEALETAR